MANAQLRMLDDDTIRDVTVLRVDSSVVHALYELNQRYREIQSALFARGNNDMMIEQLKVKLGNFFDKAYANHSNKWVREVIASVKALVLGKLDAIKTQMEGFFDSGTFDKSVDFLIDFAKGNVKVALPFWVRLMGVSTDKLLGEMGSWLKANKDMFKAGIGDAPPAING
jgi:hypothetical protein